MSDPVMTAVAVVLATKAAEGLSEGARAAYTALARLVRRKLGPAGQGALDRAQARPGDGDAVAALGAALADAAQDDPGFAAEAAALWRRLQGGVSNTVAGPVTGTVVQARDVHGGIRFGGCPGA